MGPPKHDAGILTTAWSNTVNPCLKYHSYVAGSLEIIYYK